MLSRSLSAGGLIGIDGSGAAAPAAISLAGENPADPQAADMVIKSSTPALQNRRIVIPPSGRRTRRRARHYTRLRRIAASWPSGLGGVLSAISLAARYAGGCYVPTAEELRSTVTHAFAATLADDSHSRWGKDSKVSTDGEARVEPVLPQIGEIIGVHYRLVRLLGEGMFGKVYAAQRVDVPEHQVALKLVPRSVYAGRNVERELVMLATVGHPHVVQLKDHGTTDDYVWFTMPIYEGETLGARLARGPLSLRDAHDTFLAIARGLEALHSAGLRHQDIKPDNIYLAVFAGRVHPILLDLGVAAEREATFVAGTALYASPEQFLSLMGTPGTIAVSEKMDTYCMGTTLLMALVGFDGFPGQGATEPEEITAAHETRAKEPLTAGALPDLTGHPRALLEQALCRWMALDPEARPSMSEFAEQLDVLLEPEREAARAEERQKARQKTALARLSLAVAGMVIVGIGVAGWMYSNRETLRLAGELEQARMKGAESFDKLDTCVASHKMARQKEAMCRTAQEKERAEFKQTLDDISKSGSSSQAEHAQKVAALQTSYQSKLRICEDGADLTEKSLAAERDAWGKERTKLASERDEQRSLADSRGAEIGSLKELRDQCAAEKASCISARDQCEARGVDPFSSPAPPTTTPPKPVTTSTGAPVVSPSSHPAPPEPVPPPPPPPQPPPPAPGQ
jgi:hypothetical protein